MATESLPGSVDSPVEPLLNYVRRRRGLAGVSASIALLLASGWLSSAVYPDSTFASLATGIAWSLAWLLTVGLVLYAASRVRGRVRRYRA